MKEKKSGGYQRNSHNQPLEITTARRSDTYNSFARKAAAALNLKAPAFLSSLCLFKATGGAKIVNSEIVINEISRPWTLGNYLSLLKKSASNVQIGVGYVRDDTLSDESLCFSNDGEDDVSYV